MQIQGSATVSTTALIDFNTRICRQHDTSLDGARMSKMSRVSNEEASHPSCWLLAIRRNDTRKPHDPVTRPHVSTEEWVLDKLQVSSGKYITTSFGFSHRVTPTFKVSGDKSGLIARMEWLADKRAILHDMLDRDS